MYRTMEVLLPKVFAENKTLNFTDIIEPAKEHQAYPWKIQWDTVLLGENPWADM